MSELIKYQRELRNSWLNRNSAEEETNHLKIYWQDRKSKNRKELINIFRV